MQVLVQVVLVPVSRRWYSRCGLQQVRARVVQLVQVLVL
jgi:hypothetical protein